MFMLTIATTERHNKRFGRVEIVIDSAATDCR
jgi:hypothetical protein